MTHFLRFIPSIFFIFYCQGLSFGQGNQPVLWHFKTDPVSRDEAILTITANVAPGWHLYSQFIEDGGPMPTRFTFEHNNDYILIGKPEETGKPITFHDDIYEMQITWYSGVVSFLQKIRLTQPITPVRGTIEYMICNNHLCVPNKQDFSIDVRPLKRIP